MRTLLPVALSIAIAACGGEPPADCASVGNGVKTFWMQKASVAESPEERVEAQNMALKAAERLERHCKADGWSRDFIVCARAAVQPEEEGCMKYLTREQIGQLKMDVVNPEPVVPGGLGVGN